MNHRIASATKNTLAIVLAVLAITTSVFTLGAGTASAQTMPTVSFNPTEAPAGSAIGVDGSGFQPFEVVEINYGGTTIGIGAADPNGSFSTTSTIDPSMPAGAHPMDFVGDLGSSHGVHYTVTAQPTPTSAPQPNAPTGSPAPASSSPQAPARSSSPAVIIQAPAAQQTQAPAANGGVEDADEQADENSSEDEADARGSDVAVDENGSDQSADSDDSDEQAAQVGDETKSNTWLLAIAAAVLLALGLGSGLLVSVRRRNSEESA